MKKMIAMSALVLMTVASFAQETPVVADSRRTVTVSGSAEMEIVPDEIYVVIDLKEYEKKGNKTSLEKIKTDFLEKCRSIGLADSLISIASYDGYTANPWLTKRKKKEEMNASISYQIKFTNSRKMDELVNLLDDDATQNFRIVRTWHSKMTEYRKQLKIQAVKEAKEKAVYLAEAINEKVYNAIKIVEPQDIMVQPYRGSQAMLSNVVMDAKYKADVYDSGIDFKKIKLRFEVEVVFGLR
ncbi:MAG: SIMPL domain-containing protein [Candidatus Pseudobacter hemicellulosilyticus]|uniref:SIMPL domain-containing protein n=1 Tax=Candidatus Pseudobacter hemicellulosilyticus TaxID=3121375 RepID=A0AAJ5WTH7_9BACT|nr:MAG: SIMPL domain-containing protein [Pseudobacter sp.]